jgi:hypothetical protein
MGCTIVQCFVTTVLRSSVTIAGVGRKLPDSNQKGVAHRHPRPMPNRRRFDETLKSPERPKVQFILPDDETFGHFDLRWLVDEINNEGDE